MNSCFSRVGVGSLACGLFFSSTAAWAQTTPAAAPPVATPAPSTAPAAPSAAPAAPATAQPATPTGVPPGYRLVPITEPEATTRYDVQYPQRRGALPPGMELPYEEGQPIPPGYRLVKQTRRGLVIAGSIVTGIPWTLSVWAAVTADFSNNSGFLLIPAAGPWLMLATRSDEGESGLRGVLVLDGMIQTAGAIMFGVGLGIPKKRLVRSDVTVSVLPQKFNRDTYGMSVIGTF